MRQHSVSTTVAGAVVETLRLLNVERIFGLPGIQNIELFDALADAPFTTVTPTNESSAVSMADAHARVNGKLGVVVLTAGPGLTNALTGIAEAKLDSSPVLVLVSSSGEAAGKSFQLHQIDQEAVVSPLVKGHFNPTIAAEVPQTIVRAAELAQAGEAGPTLVELSAMLLMEQGRFTFELPNQKGTPQDINSQLDDAANRLRRSKSVGLYVGAGAFGAEAEVQALAELLQAPVATTISGRGVIPEDHQLSVGFGFGRSGTAAAWRAFRRIHTLLAVGCKYGETATGSYGLKPPPEHIHIDINPDSLGANYATSVAIASDAKIALSGLLGRLSNDRRPTNTSLQESIQQARRQSETKALTGTDSSGRVSPSKFLRLLRRRLDRDAILVTDCGLHQFWALNDFPVFTLRSFLAPSDFQAMGFSIPAAIAAKFALPQRQVVSLVGDGGFLMSGFECLNAAKLGTNIVVVVFHDGAWGLIREAQRRVHRRTPFTDISTPDFGRLVESFGMRCIRISSDGEIEPALQEALGAGAPCLVEVRVNYAEPPPYVKGAGPQMFKNLPWRIKVGVGLRYLKRSLLPPHSKDT